MHTPGSWVPGNQGQKLAPGLGWQPGRNLGLRTVLLQIEALQEVLKKLKSKRIPIYEKKYGQVPMVRMRGQALP